VEYSYILVTVKDAQTLKEWSRYCKVRVMYSEIGKDIMYRDNSYSTSIRPLNLYYVIYHYTISISICEKLKVFFNLTR